MTHFNKRFLLLSALFVIELLSCTGFSAIAEQSKLTSGHFEILHYGVGSFYARIVSEAAETGYLKVIQTLGHEPEGRITITLTATKKDFNSLTRGVLPDWSSAAALSHDRIVLSPLPGTKINVEHVLTHEITHCVLYDASGSIFVPRWFHEGCAELVSGRFGLRGRFYLGWKSMREDLLSFIDIQRIFSNDAVVAGLAYDQSMLAVRYLVRVHGPDAVSEIVGGLRDGYSFDRAFETATGLSPDSYEQVYLSYLKKDYGLRALITYIPGTWTIILILAFVAWVAVKLRARRIMKRWDKEDRPGNIIDFKLPPDDY